MFSKFSGLSEGCTSLLGHVLKMKNDRHPLGIFKYLDGTKRQIMNFGKESQLIGGTQVTDLVPSISG